MARRHESGQPNNPNLEEGGSVGEQPDQNGVEQSTKPDNLVGQISRWEAGRKAEKREARVLKLIDKENPKLREGVLAAVQSRYPLPSGMPFGIRKAYENAWNSTVDHIMRSAVFGLPAERYHQDELAEIALKEEASRRETIAYLMLPPREKVGFRETKTSAKAELLAKLGRGEPLTEDEQWQVHRIGMNPERAGSGWEALIKRNLDKLSPDKTAVDIIGDMTTTTKQWIETLKAGNQYRSMALLQKLAADFGMPEWQFDGAASPEERRATINNVVTWFEANLLPVLEQVSSMWQDRDAHKFSGAIEILRQDLGEYIGNGLRKDLGQYLARPENRRWLKRILTYNPQFKENRQAIYKGLAGRLDTVEQEIDKQRQQLELLYAESDKLIKTEQEQADKAKAEKKKKAA